MRIILLAFTAALYGGAALAQSAICTNCQPERLATCGGFLEGINIGPDGRIWVVDITGNRILTVEEGQCVEQGAGGGRPNGAKFAADGALLLADAEGILRFDPADGSLAPLVTHFGDEPLRELNDLVIGADGGIYATAPAGSSEDAPIGRVFYVPPGSDSAVLARDGMAFPNGLVLTEDGRLLVAEFSRSQILDMAPGEMTGGTTVWAPTPDGRPDGMTLGPDGSLYAAIFGAAAVEVFDPNGQSLGLIRLPEGAGSFTTNVALADGVLYISEAMQGEVWRVDLSD